MANEFVEYLNSMNNANSGNINALAESQVTNKFYDAIRVERKLGSNIVKEIKSAENQVYILTGHAGDGKTSILVQILRDLELLKPGEKLEVEDMVTDGNIDLFYVKDMSELSVGKQLALLKKALDGPENNYSSILISNTGPLLNCFQEIFGATEELKDEIENKLLNQLDQNENKKVEICGYEFYLINIARIDNVVFGEEIINKICRNENWSTCIECENIDKCPIYFNYKCIEENKTSVVGFMEAYYRWLYENDKRITIRQMLSQISFAITGNIKCNDIKTWDRKTFTKFQYNFANLFFGYRGIKQLNNAKQIKAIEYLSELNLDSIALKSDYDMFVKNNFSLMPVEIRDIVQNIWNEYSKKYYIEDNNIVNLENEAEMRKAIRRLFLIYNMEDETSLKEKFSEVFSEIFVYYKTLISEKQSLRSLRPLKKMIFDALFIKNMGIPPKNENKLYITLTRHDGAFQSVLLLLGKANYDDFQVIQKERDTSNEDIEKKYDIYLSINNGKELFKLDLPILIHFKSIVDGKISTDINPALSHGLAELNSKLLKEFRTYEKDALKMIVNTVTGVIEVKAEFEDDKVYIV